MDGAIMYDGADTVVLYEELAFQDVLPLLWRPMATAIDRELTASFDERNLRLLQAWEAMDQHVLPPEKVEDAPYAAEILRLDLKLNLLLDLVGQLLVANHPRPHPVPVRFNALGAMWRGTGTLPEAGEQGIVEIYLKRFTLGTAADGWTGNQCHPRGRHQGQIPAHGRGCVRHSGEARLPPSPASDCRRSPAPPLSRRADRRAQADHS